MEIKTLSEYQKLINSDGIIVMGFAKSQDRVKKCGTRCKQVCYKLSEITYGFGCITNITDHSLESDFYCVYKNQKKIYECKTANELQLFINPVIELNDADHFEDLSQSNRKVVFDFTATWCGPCKRIAPFIRQAARKYYNKIKFVSVNVDEHNEIATSSRIKSMPSFIFFINGEELHRVLSSDERGLADRFEEFDQL